MTTDKAVIALVIGALLFLVMVKKSPGIAA